MKTIRTVLQDEHSGESGWEGAMVTLQIPDDMFEEIMKKNKSVILSGDFVNLVWNDNVLPLLEDDIAVDGVFETWVSTEPSAYDLAQLPWKNLNRRDDISFDPDTWTIFDESDNRSRVYVASQDVRVD